MKDTPKESERTTGMTKEEYSYVMKGQLNLRKFVWGTGGVQFARLDTMDRKWKKFTQNRMFNQVRREMIMRRHGVDPKEEMELKFSIGLISWKGPRTIELEDGIVWGTDKEQHMRMLDEKLRHGVMGKERADIIKMMNLL